MRRDTERAARDAARTSAIRAGRVSIDAQHAAAEAASAEYLSALPAPSFNRYAVIFSWIEWYTRTGIVHGLGERHDKRRGRITREFGMGEYSDTRDMPAYLRANYEEIVKRHGMPWTTKKHRDST